MKAIGAELELVIRGRLSVRVERVPARTSLDGGCVPPFYAGTAYLDLGEGRTLWPTETPSLDLTKARAEAAAVDAAVALLATP